MKGSSRDRRKNRCSQMKKLPNTSNMGVNKIRSMTNDEDCPYVLWSGNRRLIKRIAFEEFLYSQYSI